MDENAAKAKLRSAVLQLQNLTGQCEALPPGRLMGTPMGFALVTIPQSLLQDLVALAAQGNKTPQTPVERALAAGIYVVDTLHGALTSAGTTTEQAAKLSRQASEVLTIGNNNL